MTDPRLIDAVMALVEGLERVNEIVSNACNAESAFAGLGVATDSARTLLDACKRDQQPVPLMIRFECGQEDRVSSDYGPFEFVQLTYESLRIGPDGEQFATYCHGNWRLDDGRYRPGEAGPWSDVIIYAPKV